jgi:antirestriction protein ArdC
MRISEYIDERILAVIHALGVPICTFTQAIQAGGVDFMTYFSMMHSSGMYSTDKRIIMINDGLFPAHPLLNGVLLHELIHATGASGMLGRRTIIDMESRIPATNSGYHTEEAIAQLGALKLAKALGLDTQELYDFTVQYLDSYELADIEEAERESDRAVEYIRYLMENQYAEAA